MVGDRPEALPVGVAGKGIVESAEDENVNGIPDIAGLRQVPAADQEDDDQVAEKQFFQTPICAFVARLPSPLTF